MRVWKRRLSSRTRLFFVQFKNWIFFTFPNTLLLLFYKVNQGQIPRVSGKYIQEPTKDIVGVFHPLRPQILIEGLEGTFLNQDDCSPTSRKRSPLTKCCNQNRVPSKDFKKFVHLFVTLSFLLINEDFHSLTTSMLSSSFSHNITP